MGRRSRFQWVWNLRLELGQRLAPVALRVTEFASAGEVSPVPSSESVPTVVYGPPQWASRSFTGGFPGSAFTLQPDGTLRCPADRPLYPQEHRPERDGSLRILYAGCIGFCRTCPLREHCQESPSTKKPRRVSAVFWPTVAACLPTSPLPLPPPSPCAPQPLPHSPVLWRDWPRSRLRRQWLHLIRCQTATLSWEPAQMVSPTHAQDEAVMTRAQRAQYRLSWQQRLKRNTHPVHAPRLSILLHGLSCTFFASFGSAPQTVM